MGRPGITEADVIEAIETLLDREAKVTVESIRLHLQRGSPNTINRHLHSWRNLQQQNKYGTNDVRFKKLKTEHLALKTDFKQQQQQQQQQQLQTLTDQLLSKDLKIVQLETELNVVYI